MKPFHLSFARSFLLIFVQLAGLASAAAVTLSVAPSAISNHFAGAISLQVSGGLTNGQPVLLETYADFNGNGATDAGDLLVQSFLVADGQASVIAGVTNLNVPFDLNPAEDAIEVEMQYQASNFRIFSGAYVCRASSPNGGFTPVTAALTVTNSDFAQSITGTVLSGGTNVPNAFVAILAQTGYDEDLVGGAFTDASGNYTATAPAGTYQIIALKEGYVYDLTTAPSVTLTEGTTISTNLSLLPATAMISGKVVNAANTNQNIAGVGLTLQSTNNLMTLAFSDSNGNLNIPVTADIWSASLFEESLPALGYLTLGDYSMPEVDARGGNVSNFTIELSPVENLVHGYLRDNLSNAIPGVAVEAYNFGSYSTSVTGADGYYVVGVGTGNFYISVASDDLAALGYVGPSSTNHTFNSGEAVIMNFTAQAPTAHLIGRAVDNQGNPLSEIRMLAINPMGSGNFSTLTDTNGNFDIGVFGGTYYLQLSYEDAEARGLIGPNVSFNVFDGTNITNILFVAHQATAQITGYVRNTNSEPVAFVNIYAYATVDETNYYSISGTTDSSGNYSIGVFNGVWGVGVSSYDLAQKGYDTPMDQEVTISGSNMTANFIVYPAGPLTITTTNLPDATAGQYYWQNLNATGGSQPYSWSYTGTLPNGLMLESWGAISGIPYGSGTFNFTVQVIDNMGTMTNQSLSITLPEPDSHLIGRATRSNGTPLGNTRIYAFAQYGFESFSSLTDESGNFDIGVNAGDWSLQLTSDDARTLNVVSPSLLFTIADNTNITGIEFVVEPATAQINGYVRDTNASPITNIYVYASIFTNGTNYSFNAYTDENGNFSLPVFDGTWNLGLSSSDLYDLGYETPTNRTVEISGSNATENFVLGPVQPLQITTASLPNGVLNQWYGPQLTATGGKWPYYWSYTGTLPSGLALNSWGYFNGYPTESGTFNITVTVDDDAGNTTNVNLSITIDTLATPPAFLSYGRNNDGHFDLFVQGIAGQSYQLEGSTTFNDWTVLQSATADSSTGVVHFQDTSTTGEHRFYRARTIP